MKKINKNEKLIEVEVCGSHSVIKTNSTLSKCAEVIWSIVS